MLENRSNQELLNAWQNGSQAAAQVLVRRYMVRLTALARTHLSERLSRRVDPDDVVMSAWRSFFVAVERNRVDTPADDDLWPLLVTMTLRKLSRQAARHTAARRSTARETEDTGAGWQEAVARDPTPEEAAHVADALESCMARLSEMDREILTGRLQGESQSETATRLQCSERTIRRSLQRIREQFVQDETLTTRTAFVDDRSRSGRRQNNLQQTSVTSDTTPTARLDDLLLQSMVGAGAFGKVYRALWRPTDSQVAVKFLRRHLWKDQRAVSRLVREFEIMQQLSHPGIAETFGWGQTDEGATFVVMEWIDGHSLAEMTGTSGLDPAGVLSCGIELCEAIAAAHRADVIHGDLTPGNVLQSAGRYLLTDFGFGQVTGTAGQQALGGTPGYLAPEQVSEAFGSMTPQTDLFGLGGILYFLLTGEPPVTGRDLPEIIAGTLSASPITSVCRLNPAIPASLGLLIDQCLQKEPSARPASVEQVQAELVRISHDDPVRQ